MTKIYSTNVSLTIHNADKFGDVVSAVEKAANKQYINKKDLEQLNAAVQVLKAIDNSIKKGRTFNVPEGFEVAEMVVGGTD